MGVKVLKKMVSLARALLQVPFCFLLFFCTTAPRMQAQWNDLILLCVVRLLLSHVRAVFVCVCVCARLARGILYAQNDVELIPHKRGEAVTKEKLLIIQKQKNGKTKKKVGIYKSPTCTTYIYWDAQQIQGQKAYK